MSQSRHHGLQPHLDRTRSSSLAPIDLGSTINQNQPAQKQSLNLVPFNGGGVGSVFDQRSSAPMDLQTTNNQHRPAQRQPLILFPFGKDGVAVVVDGPSTRLEDLRGRDCQSVYPLTNEEIGAFLANAAERGQEKNRTEQGGLPFVRPDPRSELPQSMPTQSSHVTNKNLPDMSRQRGGHVASAAPRHAAKQGHRKNRTVQEGLPLVSSEARFEVPGLLLTQSTYMANKDIDYRSGQRSGLSDVLRPQAVHQGTVDLEQFCPCTLLGHDCGHRAGIIASTRPYHT